MISEQGCLRDVARHGARALMAVGVLNGCRAIDQTSERISSQRQSFRGWIVDRNESCSDMVAAHDRTLGQWERAAVLEQLTFLNQLAWLSLQARFRCRPPLGVARVFCAPGLGMWSHGACAYPGMEHVG
jgi:hypothetical protein